MSVALGGMDGAYAHPIRRLVEAGESARVTVLCFKEHLASSLISLRDLDRVQFVDFQEIGAIPDTLPRPFLNAETRPEELIARVVGDATATRSARYDLTTDRQVSAPAATIAQ